jgi:aminoglycoside phosphotransferase
MAHAQPFTTSDAHRVQLERAGLSSLAACRSFRGGVVVKALVPGRSTVRVDLAAAPSYFLKRVEGAATDEVVNEGHVLGQLRSIGLPVAEVAAIGAEPGFAALVTVALPVVGTLEREFAYPASAPAHASRRRRQVALLLRALHEAGVQHRDFYLAHLLAGEGDALFVVDFGRARMTPRLGLLRRSKDLAALDFSTPARVASDWARLRFLREYLGSRSRLRLRILALLARSRARRMRRHVERRVAQGAPNYHVTG